MRERDGSLRSDIGVHVHEFHSLPRVNVQTPVAGLTPGMSLEHVGSPATSENPAINVVNSHETFDPAETEKHSHLNEPSKTVTVSSKLAASAWAKLPQKLAKNAERLQAEKEA